MLAAACGDAATTTTQPPTTVAIAPTSVPAVTAPSPAGFPVTVDTATGSLTIDARPTRIVSLSSTATEMLFAIVAGLPDVDGEVTYYHELDPTLYSVTSATFVGELYGLLGLANVADAADPDGYGYPQLSPEYVIEQDPDLIFLADTKCCAESATTLSTRPGWDQLTAVQSGKVVELDDDIASRWGPRIVDYLAIIAAAVADLGETGA